MWISKAEEDRIDQLRARVLEAGISNRDKRKILKVLSSLGEMANFDRVTMSDAAFAMQANRDISYQYKFYDALSMWLGQMEYWKDETRRFLIQLAEKYISSFGKRRAGMKVEAIKNDGSKVIWDFENNELSRVGRQVRSERVGDKPYQMTGGRFTPLNITPERKVPIYPPALAAEDVFRVLRYMKGGMTPEQAYEWVILHIPDVTDDYEEEVKAELRKYGIVLM